MSFLESNLIYNLYLEGAAEEMLNTVLTKANATPEEKSFFSVKDGSNLLFKKSADVPILLKWIREENVSMNDQLITDYKNYLKFLSNTPLSNFESHLKWTEEVHGAVGRSEYESRHKNLKNIDVSGEDKENILADDEDVLILKGDDEHKCVRYGKGYTFCISRPFGGNMYGNYRLNKASTFYFIYFKKVPKEDERHIMVLDRTDKGWEWTFGKNKTRVIKGGWNEVISQFPVLSKYESLFVNKPLTKEEKKYQQKLSSFVKSPSLKKFKSFSYEEKATVLKFGMLIPLDVFESLDKKFLRNEWISVGPKMSDDIFNKLTDKEKERFFSVRKVQLSQREPQDKYDVEIIKKDPELYEKYIKPEEELVKEQQKLISKKVETNLKFNNKYILPDFNEMEECLDLTISAFKGEIYMPQLRKSLNIHIFPAKNVSLPRLQQSKDIQIYSATEVDLSQLQECRNMNIDSTQNLSLPQLREFENLQCSSARSLSLPKLKKCTEIHAVNCYDIDLSKLQEIKHLSIASVKKITIQSHLKDKIISWSKPEVIEPSSKEELNDSTIYDLMKSFLLRS